MLQKPREDTGDMAERGHWGILKTKAAFDPDNSLMRLGVRNARFSARGKINSYLTCKLTLEFIGRF